MNKKLGIDTNKIIWMMVFVILTLGLGFLIAKGVKK